MKKFSDLQPQNEDVAVMQQDEVVDVKKEEVDTGPDGSVDTPSEDTTVQEPVEIPQYMLNDPQWVGYPDKAMQEAVYQNAAFGALGSDVVSVLDVGCGRGDFGDYIKNAINPEIEYFGIDANQHMINAGKKKYPDLRLDNQIFDIKQFQTEGRKYDWIFHVTNLTVDYGFMGDANQYDYLDALVRKSINESNIGSVYILLNDGQRTDNYLHWNIGSVSQMLLFMGVRFAIDNTDFQNMFKLIIFNNPF